MALKTHIPLADVVGVFVDVSGQAEVANLDHIVLREQDVSGRQVSVDTLKSKEGSLLPDFYQANTQNRTLGIPCGRKETPFLWPPGSCSR